jgi:DNA-binding NarL/FixJ family response regulator
MSGDRVEGWLFLRRGTVPPAWRDRVVPVDMVPILRGEGAELLGDRHDELDPHEERILQLVAAGRSAAEIARELRVNVRSVQRRIAKIRQRVGAGSTAELVSILARGGLS